MRRRLALLVAATTSIVLLAFTLPLALLIDRAATNRAITTAADRSQRIVPVVAAGSTADIGAALQQTSNEDFAMRVLLPSGEWAGQRSTVERPPVDTGSRATEVHTLPDGRVILDQPVIRRDGVAVITTLLSEHVLDQGVWVAWVVLAGLGLLLFVLSLVVADRLARTMTLPVTDLARTAERLRRGDLSARATPSGPSEMRDVGTALNRLAGRIEELLAQEREAVADLSHQLRTPITALRLDADGLAVPDERERLSRDVDELSRRVDVLIREARRPVREGLVASCDARGVVAERVSFWEALAEEQGRAVAMSLPAQPCLVRATQADLEVAVDALLGNVIAHTPDGTDYSVCLEACPGGGARLVVSDEGPGFLDHAVLGRGESRGGSTGLGLDIVRRTATASGGGLHLGEAIPWGARVQMVLGPPAG